MAKIGIICDDYKVEMFKKELDAIGAIYNIEKESLSDDITLITVYGEQSIIKPIVDKVTKYWYDYFRALRQSTF